MIKVDRINAAYFVLFSQGSAVLYGGSFLLLVPFLLTPIEQGIWFTMLSLGAMSRLADLGFMGLLLTYVGYTRSESFKYSFADVFLFSKQWRNKILAIIFPLIFLSGSLILSTSSLFDVSILLSWFLYVIALSLLFYLVHRISIIEGLGLVRQAHFFRGMIYFLATLFTAAGIFLSSSLYSLGVGMLISLSVNLIFISRYFRGGFSDNRKNSAVSSVLRHEFFILLKKTAGSWVGGYAGIHGIIPILYILVGPVVSGMAGITLNVFLALQNFSNAFIVAKVPDITYLVAKHRHQSAKVVLLSAFFRTLLIFVVLCAFIWGGYYLFFGAYFSGRLLDGDHLLYLFIGFLFQIVISAIAVYVRAHKKEPFSTMSLSTSLFGMLTLFLCVAMLGYDLYFIGFFVSSFVAVLWSIQILLSGQYRSE